MIGTTRFHSPDAFEGDGIFGGEGVNGCAQRARQAGGLNSAGANSASVVPN